MTQPTDAPTPREPIVVVLGLPGRPPFAPHAQDGLRKNVLPQSGVVIGLRPTRLDVLTRGGALNLE